MRIAYFDCFCGAAGDMIVASLLDAGADAEALKEGLAALGVSGYVLAIEKVDRKGICATRFRVALDSEAKQPHRHLRQIVGVIEAAKLSSGVCEKAVRIFTRLAEAEAKVHGTSIDKVHFHEVGAVDAIVDIVGAVLGLELLGVERVLCSPIPVGSGTVTCAHGILPVPAPATAELLRNVPIAACDEPGELTTPTGAAVLTTLAAEFGPTGSMTVKAIGYGAGAREGIRPNVLRVLVGEAVVEGGERDQVVLIETNLDDATPQVVGHCVERLLNGGALDVWTQPIQMKKHRPGVLLSVLCRTVDAASLQEVIFRESTTLGVRRQVVDRVRLARRHEVVATPYGEIRIKVGEGEGGGTATPEFEDCRSAALKCGVALREVISAAQAAWRTGR